MDKQFNDLLQKTGEYGVVYQVSHPIVFIEGLPKVKTHEVIMFENGQKGEVFTINRGKIEARVFSPEPIKVGSKVARTNELLSIAVGKELFGHVISPLGEPLDPNVTFTKPKEVRDLDAKPIGISGRQKITTPLATGITLIDLLVPLGRGQRELIIGDRKTGKTSLLMTTIRKQIDEGNVAIYAAIAKKKSDIKKLQKFFEEQKIMDKVIIVATSSYDSPSLIYQTPYAAMAIAEYFRDQGQHTLLILDDLSTHAKFYRELSLLARRFPGRDSYPGDIFYVHSKLLERAGNFKHPTVGEVSITCLPVIEIVEGDFTGYVSTNVMGITDGHIFLDSNIYYQGMRPAVNIPLSVTRVGRQTMDKLSREINKNLTAFLTSYDKLQNLSHFGQELTDDVKKDLRLGEMIYKLFNQPYQITVPVTVQLIIISMILQNLITNKEMLEKVKTGLINAYIFPHHGGQKLLFDIKNTHELKEFNENVLKNKDKLLMIGQVKTPETPPPPTPAVQEKPNP
jgi:F-type H+-transporting ATPase subunit alpha